jgi:hypothetical protein
MTRREILGAAGLGVAAFSMSAARGSTQHPHHHDKLHGECLKACQDCATICNETFHHSFDKVKDGHANHHRVAVLTVDCQEFCRISAALMARESPLIATACRACAEACKLCADECSKHEDPQLQECAEACRKCEESCRAMVQAIAEGADDGH